MAAIIVKDLKRKAEDPLRLSTFRLRGRPVPVQKIERYLKDKGQPQELDFLANAGIFKSSHVCVRVDQSTVTPSDISCETPIALPATPESESPELETMDEAYRGYRIPSTYGPST